MKKRIVSGFTIMLILSIAGLAGAQMEFPAELKSQVDQYPKSTVVQSMNVSGTVMAIMATEDAPDQIFKFYKKQLNAKGWAIQAEMKQQDHFTLVGEKKANNIVIDAGFDQSGKSMVSVTLTPKS